MDKEIIKTKTPLLSICIPTYNRAAYLKGALENIIADDAFGNDMEIIISDNASTDNTKEIAEEYTKKYENIKYYRNNENIGFVRNFRECLKHGNGEYLKIINDTIRFTPGTLSFFLNIIKNNVDKFPFLFTVKKKDETKDYIDVHDTNEIINHLYKDIGWAGIFGIRKKDLDCLNVDSKYYDYEFAHIAWILETLKKNNVMRLYPGYYYSVDQPLKKGGYNLFRMQITYFFSILKDYGLKGKYYERAKYRCFKHQYIWMYCVYVIRKRESTFDLTDSTKIILKEYWSRPYFYLMLPPKIIEALFIKTAYKTMPRILEKIKKMKR